MRKNRKLPIYIWENCLMTDRKTKKNHLLFTTTLLVSSPFFKRKKSLTQFKITSIYNEWPSTHYIDIKKRKKICQRQLRDNNHNNKLDISKFMLRVVKLKHLTKKISMWPQKVYLIWIWVVSLWSDLIGCHIYINIISHLI